MAEDDRPQENHQPETTRLRIPMANATLVIAIVSVAGCVLYGIPGIVLALIAIVLHSRVKRVYLSDPVVYKDSYSNARAGWIIAIISLVLSVATTVYSIYALYVLWYIVPAVSH